MVNLYPRRVCFGGILAQNIFMDWVNQVRKLIQLIFKREKKRKKKKKKIKVVADHSFKPTIYDKI